MVKAGYAQARAGPLEAVSRPSAQPRRSGPDDASGCWRPGLVLALIQPQRRVPNHHGLGHPGRRCLTPMDSSPGRAPQHAVPCLGRSPGWGRAWGLLWARASPPTRSDSPSSWRGDSERSPPRRASAQGRKQAHWRPSCPPKRRGACPEKGVPGPGLPAEPDGQALVCAGVLAVTSRPPWPPGPLALGLMQSFLSKLSPGTCGEVFFLPLKPPLFLVLRFSVFASSVFLHLLQADPVPGVW